jgi:hypothetical protein
MFMVKNKKSSQDISNRTVVTMLVVVIVVSVVSLGLYLAALNEAAAKVPKAVSTDAAKGKISLNIIEDPNAPKKPDISSEKGTASLQIIKVD